MDACPGSHPRGNLSSPAGLGFHGRQIRAGGRGVRPPSCPFAGPLGRGKADANTRVPWRRPPAPQDVRVHADELLQASQMQLFHFPSDSELLMFRNKLLPVLLIYNDT